MKVETLVRLQHRELEAQLAALSQTPGPERSSGWEAWGAALAAHLTDEEGSLVPRLAAAEVKALRDDAGTLRGLLERHHREGDAELVAAFGAHVDHLEGLFAPRSATDERGSILDDDHEQLELMLEDVVVLADHRSFQTAAKRFGELRRELEKHLRDEEEIIVPSFVERTGDPADAAATLHAEHIDLCRMLDALSRALSAGDHQSVVRQLPAFERVLRHHCETEDHVLAPALVDLLPTSTAWHAFIDGRRRRERLTHVDQKGPGRGA